MDADPDPAYHFDADSDPTFQFDANPDPQHWLELKNAVKRGCGTNCYPVL